MGLEHDYQMAALTLILIILAGVVLIIVGMRDNSGKINYHQTHALVLMGMLVIMLIGISTQIF